MRRAWRMRDGMPYNKNGDRRWMLGWLVCFLLSGRCAATDLAPAPAAAAPSERPPLISESPPVAPLYSAYVAAGLLPEGELKSANRLKPLPADSHESHPVFVSADKIRGANDNEMVAEGAVQLRQLLTTLDADRVTYWQNDDEVEAMGNVRLKRENDFFSGPLLRLKMKTSLGFFATPHYSISRGVAVDAGQAVGVPGVAPAATKTTTAIGDAERVDFQGKDLYKLSHATFSTCKPGVGGNMPDWYADVGELTLDYRDNVGDARDAKIVFRSVPILYSPWLSFSLNNQRKSGLLTPTFGSTNNSGLELTTPYYWNIAPNMDATISPRLMTRRGTQWNEEFRYLEPMFSGTASLSYLPADRMTQTNRTGYSLLHNQNFGSGFSGNLSVSGVSDDTYFSDLSTSLLNTSQGNLLRQASVSYGAAWWNASAMVQRYQTLQDPDPTIPRVAEPYRREPQLTLNASRPDLAAGTAMVFSGEYVNFEHPTQDVGQRAILYPQFSLPMRTAAFYVTPKLGLNLAHYSLDRRTTTGPDTVSREVPILSVDSGVAMERSSDWNGRNLTQTLEPRLYYLYVPARDQSQIPVFDSGLADFNFAQIFSENRYSGGDRVGDANQVTAALTSRLVDPDTGIELVRGAIGQRYYFATQQVTLPGEIPRSNRSTDILASFSSHLWSKVSMEAAWDYNQYFHQTMQMNLGGRYQPEAGKVLNMSYVYNANVATMLRQVDVSAQWPVWGRWRGVGRYDYSLLDRRLIESIAGFEYDGGCWTSRFVVQRLATATATARTYFFVQLELNDFSQIGSNPLDVLKRSIPGYSHDNLPSADRAPAND
jgi:LPS-assembly protein